MYKLLAIFALPLLLLACGGGGGGGGGGTSVLPLAQIAPGTKLGGAIEGTALNLSSTVTSLAGSGTAGFANGIGTAASFNFPYGITTDGTYLYVSDYSNHLIRKIIISTGAVSTLAGTGTWGAADGTGTTASFNSPRGITTDGTNIYVADSWNGKIRKIEISTGVVSTLATSSSFALPEGITTDGTNLYLTDIGSTIRKIVITSGIVSTLASGFNNPQGITTDGISLYVADGGNILRVVIASGAVSTVASGFGSLDSITTDGTYLYVTSTTYQHKVSKVSISTGAVSVIAGGNGGGSNGTICDSITDYQAKQTCLINLAVQAMNGTLIGGDAGFGSADGIGTAASFHSPRGITTDGTSLFVADSFNDKIRKIQ